MKYAPRKVYVKENDVYAELSYTDFCRRRQADQSYMDKLFIPVQGCLLEVVREQYADFYKDKERWRYLKKLDTDHSLLSLEGFTDSEGNVIDFVVDEAVDVAETVVHGKKNKAAEGYEVQCATDKKYKKNLKKATIKNNARKTVSMVVFLSALRVYCLRE